MARRVAKIALLSAAAIAVSPAATYPSDFFGSANPLQVWPEVDVVVHAAEGFRVIGKLEPVFIPADGRGTGGFSVYGDWLVSPITGTVLTPDLAKRRRLDLRLGASWFPTWWPGTGSPSDVFRLSFEGTMRTDVPGGILATLRNRVEAQWQLDAPTSFTWRLRLRPQLERAFALSEEEGTSLTPFGNVEFIWTTAQDMWAQFRMQVGLQLGVRWFGRGQVLEVNAMSITYLQPTRNTSPVVGFVWYQYF